MFIYGRSNETIFIQLSASGTCMGSSLLQIVTSKGKAVTSGSTIRCTSGLLQGYAPKPWNWRVWENRQ